MTDSINGTPEPAQDDRARSAIGHPGEAHDQNSAGRLNWLRAGVLGANDGILSVSGLVIGVAGATTSSQALLTAGTAGLVAGAVSMALGEYVSVSTQRDAERALIAKEKAELAEDPHTELAELAQIYQQKGLSSDTAQQVAEELTAHDALGAHLDAELNIDPDGLTNPLHAAIASAIAFTIGALLPVLTIVLLPRSIRVPITFVAVLLALAMTGYVGARIGGASGARPTVRMVIGGAIGMAATYGIGALIGMGTTG
ncbi:MAG: VIT family protein [Antricoccus sp.]